MCLWRYNLSGKGDLCPHLQKLSPCITPTSLLGIGWHRHYSNSACLRLRVWGASRDRVMYVLESIFSLFPVLHICVWEISRLAPDKEGCLIQSTYFVLSTCLQPVAGKPTYGEYRSLTLHCQALVDELELKLDQDERLVKEVCAKRREEFCERQACQTDIASMKKAIQERAALQQQMLSTRYKQHEILQRSNAVSTERLSQVCFFYT